MRWWSRPWRWAPSGDAPILGPRISVDKATGLPGNRRTALKVSTVRNSGEIDCPRSVRGAHSQAYCISLVIE